MHCSSCHFGNGTRRYSSYKMQLYLQDAITAASNCVKYCSEYPFKNKIFPLLRIFKIERSQREGILCSSPLTKTLKQESQGLSTHLTQHNCMFLVIQEVKHVINHYFTLEINIQIFKLLGLAYRVHANSLQIHENY